MTGSTAASARARAALAAACLALVFLAAAPARSQTEEAPATPPAEPPRENWAVGCSSANRAAPIDCSVEQRAVDGRSGRQLAMVRVRVPNDTRAPVMLVQVPLGVSLPAKLVMDVDGKDLQPVEYQSCDAAGCYAGFPVSTEFLDMLMTGQTLGLKVQNQRKEPTTLPITLTGFAKAYAQIE